MGDVPGWFVGDTSSGDPATGISPVLRYNEISFFVDAEEMYADLRGAVTSLGSPEHFICWIGFEVSGSTPLPAAPASPPIKPFPPRASVDGDSTWLDELARATNRGAHLRALLNLHPSPKPHDGYVDKNLTTVAKLNRLKNTVAINDFRYLFMNGTHHQKLVLVYDGTELYAYVGTMDVHWQRINDRWCEVGCKVHGEAARELYRVFFSRWGEHTEMIAKPPDGWQLPDPASVRVKSAGGKLLAQASVTFGNSTRTSPFRPLGESTQVINAPHRLVIRVHPLPVLELLLSPGLVPNAVVVANDFFAETDPAAPPLIASAAKQKPQYASAPWVLHPSGRTGIYRQLAAALGKVQKYLYIEDQYLVDDLAMGGLASMLDLLVAVVKKDSFRKLVILCTRIQDINDEFQGTAAAHRRAFVQQLTAAGGNKVAICQYKSNQALGRQGKYIPPDKAPFYVHSKTWVFDDEFLVVGSANCNRRGYSHDSELDFAVYDTEKAEIAALRRKLWLRRLNTEPVKTPLTDADVRDFEGAAKYWEDPDQYGLALESSRKLSLDALVPNSQPPKIVLDGMGYGPTVDVIALAKANYASWLWDAVVDPDGT